MPKGNIALKHYSYISLFGVNSLDEFKYSIFENSVKSSDIGLEPSLETMRSNTTAVAKRLGMKSLGFIQQMPWFKNHIGGLGPVWFLSVKKTVICVDDIERRGDNLSIRDVLGLVSNLKEHKGCKIVLILNDEALERDKKDFDIYLEKVVDTSFKFAPSAQECARIALATDTKTNKLLAENCVTLGISNIRLIKKVERAVHRMQTMLKAFDEEVLKRVLRSLVLFGWSVYEPSRAPSLDYLKRRKPDLFGRNKNETIPANEAAWNALLDAYGFAMMDEFDQILLDGIRNGFFDPSLVEKHALELNNQIMAAKADSSVENGWRMFHDSFADNQEQVLEAVYQSSVNNIQHVTLLNLDGTVWLLKELGRADQAAEIIKRYIDSRGENRSSFDLDHFPFKEKISDPDVIQALNDKFATFKYEAEPAIILQSMVDTQGWNSEQINTLSTSSVDEYYNIFKRSQGQALRKIIDACLQFDRISNASPPMKEISKRAKEALKRISQESPINALRARKYGVNL
jgi:hypothetical protein